MAEPFPRSTRFWQKQAALLAESDREAFSDRMVQLRVMRCVELLAAEVGLGIIWKDKADVVALSIIRHPGETLGSSFEALVRVYLERSSSAAHAFSLAELKAWCAWRVESELRLAAGEDAQTLLEEAKGRPILTRLAHFLPDNPTELQPNGSLRGYEKAKTEHWLQLRSWSRSRLPAGRPGRPPTQGRVLAHHAGGKRPLDPELCRSAAHMRKTGSSLKEIGLILAPGRNLDHIRRLIEKGMRLANH